MASPFDALDEAVSATVAETMGEALRITPRVARQYVGPADDPSRPVRDVVGVYSAAPTVDNLTGQRESNKLDTMVRFTTGRHEVWLPVNEARRIGYAIQAQDLVTVEASGLRLCVTAALTEAAGDIRLIATLEDDQ